MNQTWRGFPMVEEPRLPDGQAYWVSDTFRRYGRGVVLLAGIRRFRELKWENDPDEWYAAELERLRERAPA